MKTVFTIGYSGIEQERFVDLLERNSCSVVCDVRSYPVSKYRPEFSQGQLKKRLNMSGIKYAFFGNVLGARPKERSCYRNGVASYELIAKQASFQTALNRLANGAKFGRLVLVCSEADPIECHRAILVSKNLVSLVPDIKHIHGNGRLEDHVELEDRLIELYGTAPPPLLRTAHDRELGIQKAYEKQGDAICYSENAHWKNNEALHNRIH